MTIVPQSQLQPGRFYWWTRQMPWTAKSFTFDKRCLVKVGSNGENRTVTELDSGGDPAGTQHYVDDIAEHSSFYGPVEMPDLKDDKRQGRFA